jgi:DNA-binding NarL/FixJ family response regulator
MTGDARVPSFVEPWRRPLRVLVVDDHPIFRRGLIDVINDEPGMMVCGEAEDSAGARAIAAERQPDVAVVDLGLRDENGLDLVAAFATQAPMLRVLVMSCYDEQLYAVRACQAGALGYLMKHQAAWELLGAIRCVAGGKPFVSTAAAERMLATLGPSPAAPGVSVFDRLSNRERHVFSLLARGLATREIAAALRLSIKTVESHYANLKKKLGARNGRELTRLAIGWSEHELRS